LWKYGIANPSPAFLTNEALGLTLATQAGIDENRWTESACLLGSVERFDNLIGRVAPTPINPTRKA
jgi:hypothetical protein